MNHILLWFNSPIWIEFSVIPCDSLTERRNPLDRLDLGSSRRSFQPVGPSASSQNKILRSYAKRHPLWIGWLWQPSQLVGPLPQTWSKIALFLLISTFKQDDVRVAPFLGTLKQVQQGASQSYHIATTTTVNVYVQFFVVDVSPSHLPPAQQATARHLPGMLSFDWGISGASGDEQFGKLLPKLVTLYFHIWTVFGFCCIFCPSYWDDFVGIKKTTVLVASGSITLTTSDRIQSRNGWSSPSWKHGRMCPAKKSESKKSIEDGEFCE